MICFWLHYNEETRLFENNCMVNKIIENMSCIMSKTMILLRSDKEHRKSQRTSYQKHFKKTLKNLLTNVNNHDMIKK
jgi:uncharacterized protein YnzC (UPF0291/DUF896 family)